MSSAETSLDNMDPPADDNQETDGRRRIGEIFVELGFITNDQLEAVLEVQREQGGRIGEILVAQGSLTRLDLASALSEHWQPQRPTVVPELRRPKEPEPGQDWLSDGERTLFTLEERLRAAEQRLDAVDGTSGRPGTWLGGGPGGTEQPKQAAHVDDLATGLAELGVRTDRLEESLGQVADRGDAAAGEWIESSGKQIEARLDAAEGNLAALASFEERLVATARLIDDLERGSVTGLSDLTEQLRARDEEAARVQEELAEVRAVAEEGRAGVERIDAIAPDTQALTTRLEELAAQLEALNARVDAHGEDESARVQESLTGIRELVEQGRADVDCIAGELRSELGALARQLDELRGLRSADEESSHASREDVLARLAELSDRLDSHGHAGELEGLTARVEEMSASQSSEIEEIGRVRDELSTRLDELRGQLGSHGHEGEIERVRDELSARLDELSAHLDELAGRLESHSHDDRLATVNARLDELADARAADAEAVRRYGEVLSTRLEELEAQVDAPAEHGPEQDLGPLSARIEELHALRSGDAEANERIAKNLFDRLDELAARIEAHGEAEADEASLVARVDELAGRVAAQEDRAGDAAAVHESLASARELAEQDRVEFERVTGSLRLEVGSLSGRLDELSGLRSADTQEARRLRDELFARLDELTARSDERERHDAALARDAAAEDEVQLWEVSPAAPPDDTPVEKQEKDKKKGKKKRKQGD